MDTAAVADQKPAKPPLDPLLKARRLARVHEPRRKPRRLTLKTLSQLDQRCVAAKRVRQLVSTWENELGGADNMTESLRQLIQRGALLSVLIESSRSGMAERRHTCRADLLHRGQFIASGLNYDRSRSTQP